MICALPGRADLPGVTWDGDGVNVALRTIRGTAADFCVFDPAGVHEIARLRLPYRTDKVWHAYVPGIGPGTPYGFRVHGAFDPRVGDVFNSQKLLVDPYARALCGNVSWSKTLSDTVACDQRARPEDTARFVPKSVVVNPRFDWEGDVKPDVPWRDTVIYECHVKGLTFLHPDVPADHRGRYPGLASEPVIDHLKRIGVTAVELLPVQHSIDEYPLVERGLVNYWGYNPLAFFAPDARYATGDMGQQVVEFKDMVKRLHSAGIEVIIDVVFNHTAEGDHTGPTLSLKGIDNAEYYRLESTDKGRYENWAGCGNTLHFGHESVLQLTMDCLRYWVEEMHVDGFRFDLASVLTRGLSGEPAFDGIVSRMIEDSMVGRVKLIAEPWDASWDGHLLGRFPRGWTEWNDAYRRSIRRFWKGDAQPLGELARRLSGSSDIFKPSGRNACASLNFITSHDGFILRDLVSYEQKRNEPNGQNNSDGANDNDSCNWGVEGETDDTVVLESRRRMQRNFLATLLLSRGVPMIVAGDPSGHTQNGNNNAYCQDNETSWLNWSLDREQRQLLAFTQGLTRLRRRFAVVRSCDFFEGSVRCRCGLKDVTWLRHDGTEMQTEDWEDPFGATLAVLLHDHSCGSPGLPDEGVTAIIVIHRGADRVEFPLPQIVRGGRWTCRLDTASAEGVMDQSMEGVITVQPQAVVLCEYI